MKNIADVLKQKEAELQQLQVEIDALRLVLRLVSEDAESGSHGRALVSTGTTPNARVEEVGTPSNPRRFP